MTQQRVEFFVVGLPKTAGNKRPIRLKNGKLAVREITKNEDWIAAIQRAALIWFDEPVRWENIAMNVVFYMPRPKYHFKKNGELKSNAPFWHNVRPDRTKLLRCLEDALIGVALPDDARVVVGTVTKCYGNKTGALISLSPCTEPAPSCVAPAGSGLAQYCDAGPESDDNRHTKRSHSCWYRSY